MQGLVRLRQILGLAAAQAQAALDGELNKLDALTDAAKALELQDLARRRR